MSFRETVAEEIEEATTNTDNDSSDDDFEQIELDMGNTPFVKFNPTTLVSGTFPEDEGNPIILFKNYDRLNELEDQGSPHIDDNGNDLRFTSTRYLGLVVDDLTILQDEDEGMGDATFVRTGDDDSTAYRAVNLADDDTEYKYEGAAVRVGDKTYDIEEEVDTIEGRAILVVDRTAHVSVARKLDRSGELLAGMDEATGRVNDGLIEYPTADAPDNAERRYARPFVELRDDLKGREVGFMVTNRSDVDEEYAELVESGDARDMMWYSVFDMETSDPIAPTTTDTAIRSWLAWRFDEEAGRLPEEDYNFVQQYIDAGQPTEEGKIRENIEANLDRLSDDPNEDRIVTLIQSQADN